LNLVRQRGDRVRRSERVERARGDGVTPASGSRTRVLICDDHRILTDTLKEVIEQDPTLDLVRPPVYSAEEAVDAAVESQPDVVLMDVEFKSGMNGIEATRRIRERCPDTVVVVMTAHQEERILVEAVEAGAAGFLRKTEGVEEFLKTIKAAAAGEILIDRSALAQALPYVAQEREDEREARLRLSRLTPREREILQLSAEGLRNEEIGARLLISPQTAQTHTRNILAKLAVHSKLEAVAFAVRHGAVSI
jgi:DNA-binding NarL/FixJ family response regulator